MFSKIITLCALVAVTQAGLLPAAVHYSSADAVSSQSIVRHDQSSAVVSKLAVAAPAPVVYKAAPAPVVYKAATAPVVYQPAPIKYAVPVTKAVSNQEEEIAYPKYEFSYSVADEHSGDNKSQQESRDGDAVKGSYTFVEADGSVRSVEYSADDHSGFNAVVHNSAPTAAPSLVKAPVYAAPAPSYYYKH